MNSLLPLLIATLFLALAAALIIWLTGRLGLGLEVAGFGSALAAAILIALVAGVITVLLSLLGVQDGDGLIGGFVHLLVAAGALWISGRLLPGVKVAGYGGALLAAVAIGALYWLGGLALGLLF